MTIDGYLHPLFECWSSGEPQIRYNRNYCHGMENIEFGFAFSRFFPHSGHFEMGIFYVGANLFERRFYLSPSLLEVRDLSFENIFPVEEVGFCIGSSHRRPSQILLRQLNLVHESKIFDR